MMALSLFGTVSGLEVRTFGQLPISLSDEWIALSTGDLRLTEDGSVVAVHRRSTDAGILTWVGLYRAAIEMTSDRGGGYFGAGVWLLNKTAAAQPTLSLLNELTREVRKHAMSGLRFVRRLSAAESAINWHDEIGRLVRQSLVDIPQGLGLRPGDAPKAFFDAREASATSAPPWLVDAAQSGSGFFNYRSLFISGDEEVVESARRGGRLEILTPEKLLKGQVTHEQAMQRAVIDAKREVQQTAQALKAEEEARKGVGAQLQSLRLEYQEALSRLHDLQSQNDRYVADLSQHQSEIESMRREAERIQRDILVREESLAATARQQEEQQRRQLHEQADINRRALDIEAQGADLERRKRHLQVEQSVAEQRVRKVQEAEAKVAEAVARHKLVERELAAATKAREGSDQQFNRLRRKFGELQDENSRILSRLEKRDLATQVQQTSRKSADPPRLVPMSVAPASVYQDQTKQKQRHSWRGPVSLLAMGTLVAMSALAFVFWPVPQDANGEYVDARLPPQQRCAKGWVGPDRNGPFGTIRRSEGTSTNAIAGALWGMACGEKKREVECFEIDVARMAKALDRQGYAAQGNSMPVYTVRLPRYCGLPTSQPLTISASEAPKEAPVAIESVVAPGSASSGDVNRAAGGNDIAAKPSPADARGAAEVRSRSDVQRKDSQSGDVKAKIEVPRNGPPSGDSRANGQGKAKTEASRKDKPAGEKPAEVKAGATNPTE